MSDEAIYAFSPVPRPPAPAPRRLWPWVLGGLLLLSLLALVSGVTALMSMLDSARHGVHVNIDGEDLDVGWSLGSLGLLGLLGGALGLLAGLLALLCVVPLTLLLVALGLLLGFGGVLLGVGVVAALVLSPLWGLLLLAWLLLRRRPAATVRP